MRILVIEDDPTVGQYVKRGLEEHRWAVDLVVDGEDGERRASSEAYDLVILDMRLPGKSGLEVLHALRAKGFERPVLVLTAQDAVDAKVATLRAGADDYVTKPFGAAELLARVRAALRRNATGALPTSEIRLGEITIDLARRELHGAAEVRLTPLEYRVLEHLARQPGTIVKQERLIREVWGPAQVGDTRSLRVCIRNLRAKLEPDPHRPRYLVTEAGVGYRLRVTESADAPAPSPRPAS